jgi:hypothetical protein
MGCFATYFKIIIVFVGCAGLFACSSSNVFVTSNFKVGKEDRQYALDSFKVKEVIDRRAMKDTIIGIADEDSVPLIIDRPLPEFLKALMNAYISKPSIEKRSYIPVTVYLDDFYADRKYTFFNKSIHFRYSYVFEYPDGDHRKSVFIADSLRYYGKVSVEEQSQFIVAGIFDASYLFTSYIRDKSKLSSELGITFDTTNTANSIDSINLKPFRNIDYKSGILFNYSTGTKNNYGLFFSFIGLFQTPNSKLETGFGLLGYYRISVNQFKEQKNLDGLYIYKQYRYNFSASASSFFLDSKLNFGVGSETGGGKLKETSEYLPFVFLGRLEETVGFTFFGNLSLNVGLYQQGVLFSKILPYDLGFVFSLSLAGY